LIFLAKKEDQFLEMPELGKYVKVGSWQMIASNKIKVVFQVVVLLSSLVDNLYFSNYLN